MASGFPFNMNEFVVAHPWHDFGTVLRVSRKVRGKVLSATVTVCDRGPFVEGRGMDVSYAVATELELIKPGTGSVVVTVLYKPKTPQGKAEGKASCGAPLLHLINSLNPQKSQTIF